MACHLLLYTGLLPSNASLLTWENSSGVKASSGMFAWEITVDLGSECFQFQWNPQEPEPAGSSVSVPGYPGEQRRNGCGSEEEKLFHGVCPTVPLLFPWPWMSPWKPSAGHGKWACYRVGDTLSLWLFMVFAECLIPDICLQHFFCCCCFGLFFKALTVLELV